jgi:5-(carboxyamino)imidazole ribonucleotide synthase
VAEALAPGAVIGILGGGQLGRMLAVAAARLGFHAHIYDPSPEAPAREVARTLTAARFTDAEALADFAGSVDVVTFEFENVPASALDVLEPLVPVRPTRRALAIAQDRLDEKDFLAGLGLRPAPYAPVETEDELRLALSAIGTPAILKTRRMGYDGKGQLKIFDARQVPNAIRWLDHRPAVLEGFIDFDREISVIGARGLDGAVVCYDPGENVHRDGILRTTTVPASIDRPVAEDAVLAAGKLLNALDYVGVLGLELFVTGAGLIVNEFAPRVHNSGHWTQNGCVIDQFEQHIRAIAGWPLGDGQRHSSVVMTNLVGHDVADLAPHLGDAIHLYGKAEMREGRKMGHVNRVLR